MMDEIERIQQKFQDWRIDEPHFLDQREGNMGGEVGRLAHYRTFAGLRNRASASARFTVIGVGISRQACLKDLEAKLLIKNAAYQQEI